jgi:hypothetical protein
MLSFGRAGPSRAIAEARRDSRTDDHRFPNTWTVWIQLSDNDYLNLSREFDTQVPPIVARFTDAIGPILQTKTSEMVLTDPIHMDITIGVGQVQPASGLDKHLQPITMMIRNP